MYSNARQLLSSNSDSIHIFGNFSRCFIQRQESSDEPLFNYDTPTTRSQASASVEANESSQLLVGGEDDAEKSAYNPTTGSANNAAQSTSEKRQHLEGTTT